MGVQNLALLLPPDGITDWPLRVIRPQFLASWENNGAGGTVDYTVLHEWDTSAGFASGNLIQDSNTTPDASTFTDIGVPPSDMGPDGQLWYYRFTVTDNDDSGSLVLAANVEITFEDGIHQLRFLGAPVHVQPDFSSGGIDDPIAARRQLYAPVNVGPGWEVGLGDDRLEHFRHLYAPVEVTTDVPVPYLVRIVPTIVEGGDALLVEGYGFDNAARDWSAAARLYDVPDPQAPGATFVALTESSYVDSTVSSNGLDQLIVLVGAGASSGHVVVVNDSGV